MVNPRARRETWWREPKEHLKEPVGWRDARADVATTTKPNQVANSR
jgi:hypothetical protein